MTNVLRKLLLVALPYLGLATCMLPATTASATGQHRPAPPIAPSAATFDHSVFDRLLKKHVDEKGLVNYKGFRADVKAFDQYLAQLSSSPPTASWSRQEQMAYWINAYNAYTIRLILNHYPVKSIKDIGSRIKIPFVTTPWAAEFFSIGGQKMSLDNIEHSILRKKYDDPRIHFALVCASISCPRLRNEAYTAARLDSQLDDQGREFLNNPAKNNISKASAQLSKYFDWYKGDWNESGQSVPKWVNRYAKTKMSPEAKITFLDYNWNLNEQ